MGQPSNHKAADFPRQDLANPSQFRLAVQHIANVHQMATPEQRTASRQWYPKVHDAVSKGIKGSGLSHKSGSGLVAALSPNMDFDKVNIPAFGELKHINSGQWDAIHRSAESGGRRTPEASDALRGMSLSQVADSALVKAHRIIRGEDPEDVMPRMGSPKTNSFMSNIHDPHGSPHVTIDGRAHDIGQNEMWPWTYSGRGISSAGTKTGKKTRYEHFEDAYRTAASAVGEEHPSAMQAITWEQGKRIEKSAPTKSGAPRKIGVRRERQPYV